MLGSLACQRAHREVKFGVSSKELTEGGKIAGSRHILTGLMSVLGRLIDLYHENFKL